MQSFLQALSLLTRLPVRAEWPADAKRGRALAWAPGVGLLIGLFLAVPVLVVDRWLGFTSPLLPAAMLLAWWAMLTGALHLDGWANGCDAFFTRATPGKRLQAMDDPRLGVFGVTCLILLLAVKGAALHGVILQSWVDGSRALLVLILAPVAARLGLVLVVATQPLAKPDGLGRSLKNGLGAREIIIATLLTGIVAALIGRSSLVPLAGALAGALCWAGLARHGIGGVTDDVFGGAVELGETAALVAACSFPG